MYIYILNNLRIALIKSVQQLDEKKVIKSILGHSGIT